MRKKRMNRAVKTPKALFVVLLLIGCIPIILFLLGELPLQRSVPPRGDDALRALQQRYYLEKSEQQEKWWMEKLPRLDQEEMLTAVITDRLERIHAALNVHDTVSPFAQELAAHYKAFVVSLAISSQTSVTVLTEGERKRLGKVPEITFVSRDKVKAMNSPFSLYWRSDWGLLMYAVEFPPPVFAGLLFHELGHGYVHPIAPGTVYFKFDSREYAAEEVRMHELETLVMDQASGGAFLKNVRSIVSREKNAQSFEKVLHTLTIRDLHRLDESLGASGVGLETAELLFPHYLMAIGLEYIRVKEGNDDEQIRLFRWMQTILGR